MAWALRFAGGTEIANFSTVNRTDSAWRVEFRIANKSLTSNLTNRIMTNQSSFNDYVEARWRNSGDYINYRVDAVSYIFTHALNISGDNDFHNYIIECDGTNLSASIDGNSLGSTVASPFFKDFGRFNGTQDLEYFRYYNLDGGETLIYNWDAESSSHASGTVTLDELVSGNDAIGVGMPTDGSAWIDLGGGITVIAGSQDYEVDFYDSIVSLTGEVAVTGESQSYSVSFYDAAIELTGEVLVNADSQDYQVQFFDGQVGLVSGVEVQAQSQSYDVTFFDASVNLSGEINVSAESQNYSVTFYDATVSISELWTNKPRVNTNWTDQAKAVTIWSDK